MSEPGEDVEKPHAPTPRRLQKAREKGEIARSTDLNAAAAYAGLLLALLILGPATVARFGGGLTAFLDRGEVLARLTFEQASAAALGGILRNALAGIVLLILIPAAAVLLTILVQRSFVVTPDKLRPRLSRISLIANAKNKFGRGGLFEFAKSTTKLVIYSGCLAVFLVLRADQMAGTARAEPGPALVVLARLAMEFLTITVVIATSVGLIDYLWQHSEHLRKNRMSDRELRDEMKDAEGDPQVKQQRRQRGQEIAMNQMMAEVPRADVVIVNPTHYAVALAWDRSRGSAPKVVAKGVDELARRIREIADGAAVPIHHDPPIARALFDRVQIGQQIAPDHYRAVATAIRFADQMRRRARAWGQ